MMLVGGSTDEPYFQAAFGTLGVSLYLSISSKFFLCAKIATQHVGGVKLQHLHVQAAQSKLGRYTQFSRSFELVGGDLVTLDELLDVRGTGHGLGHPQLLHALPDVDLGRRVFADGDSADEPIGVRDESLLKVQRPVVKIHQLRYNLQKNVHID